jgi:hypothetical protein
VRFLGDVASCAFLLLILLGGVAFVKRADIREFFADITETWRDVTRIQP